MREPLSASIARLVTPRAIRNYAQALGWVPVANVKSGIAVFHQPQSDLHQLIVPLDETFDDYAELIEEAVRKLSEFEQRPPQEVLNHLLLPPADVLRFRDASPETEGGTVLLEHGINLLSGSRRMLLSLAHSILKPQPYHPRLRRTEAEQFIRSCRMGQTERGSFVVTVACPLNYIPGTTLQEEPFARQVTQGVISTLHAISRAARDDSINDLFDHDKYPLLSANFCEAMLMLRPVNDRALVEVDASWSKATSPPSRIEESFVQLRPETFEAAEYVAPQLRSFSEPKPASFVGYVDILRGQADASGEMCGDVVFSIMLEDGETLRARAELSAPDYSEACSSHLKNTPVSFRGVLIRAPRSNYIVGVTEFRRVQT